MAGWHGHASSFPFPARQQPGEVKLVALPCKPGQIELFMDVEARTNNMPQECN